MVRRFVLTGTPGAGKTVLGDALQERGYVVVPEAATDVIAAEQARGVAVPWEREDFVERIVLLQRQRQLASPTDGDAAQVYDRSPLCTLALARFLQRPIMPALADEVARVLDEQVYQRDVFLVRPLGFVTPTAARRISYQESLVFEQVHQDVYVEHGFRLVDVPAGDVASRASLVDEHIRSLTQIAKLPSGGSGV